MNGADFAIGTDTAPGATDTDFDAAVPEVTEVLAEAPGETGALDAGNAGEAAVSTSAADGPAARDGDDPDVPGDGAADAAADSADAGADGAGILAPDMIRPGHLQLWLRGDRQVTCVGDRVTIWGDGSGKGNHARPPAGKVGPGCDGLGATLNGRTAIRFPLTAALATEEYLEVSLASLKDRAFTIAIVEQRTGEKFNAWVVGSPLPDPSAEECAVANVNAGQAVLLGYPAANALSGSTWGPACVVRGRAPRVVVRPSATVMILDPAKGIALYANGDKVAESASPKLISIEKGFIGRGWQSDSTRFKGDLAEVVVFDVALTDGERHSLEAYLRDTWASAPSTTP